MRLMLFMASNVHIVSCIRIIIIIVVIVAVVYIVITASDQINAIGQFIVVQSIDSMLNST